MTDAAETLDIGQLTDEELAVIATTDGVAVFPVLGRMSAEHRTVALQTAYRSLVARGLLLAPTAEDEAAARRRDGDDAELPVRMPESMAHVLALRAGAQRVVAVSRMTAMGEEYRYAYVVEDVVLEEHVTGTGLHSFVVGRRARLADLVAGWVLHPEAGDGSGDPVPLGAAGDAAPPMELLERVGAALLRADLVVREPGDSAPLLLGVFSGPAGTWLGEARSGSGAPVDLVPTSVAAVRDRVRAAVASP